MPRNSNSAADPRTFEVLLVPFDSGFHRVRMGVGPERLLKAGAFDALPQPVAVSEYAPQSAALRGEISSAADVQRWLARRVADCRTRGALPIVVAGNCMTSVGTFAGLRSVSRAAPGVCWFDAHGDFNTPETSESGFLDGMALATLTGRCWTSLTKTVPHFRPAAESAVVMFGTRDLDRAERTALRASRIHWPRTPSRRTRSHQVLGTLRRRVSEVYLHVDLDVLDEKVARANQFACSGGLSVEELLDHVREIGSRLRIGAAALTAYDPTVDPDGRIPPIAREIVRAIATHSG